MVILLYKSRWVRGLQAGVFNREGVWKGVYDMGILLARSVHGLMGRGGAGACMGSWWGETFMVVGQCYWINQGCHYRENVQLEYMEEGYTA